MHTEYKAVTFFFLNNSPFISTGGNDFQPLGSTFGPGIGVPSLYACSRKGDGLGCLTNGVYPIFFFNLIDP